jgi:CHRD domain
MTAGTRRILMSSIRRVTFILALLLLCGANHALAQVYAGQLSGPGEAPPNASPGTGATAVTYTMALHTLQVDVNFSGLVGTTTASHIHCCVAVAGTGTAGVATQTPTFSGFPLGVTAGTYSQSFDLTLAGSFNPAYVTASGGTAAGAEAALVAGIAAGKAYLNVHSSVFGGGEIRTFLLPDGIFKDGFDGP